MYIWCKVGVLFVYIWCIVCVLFGIQIANKLFISGVLLKYFQADSSKSCTWCIPGVFVVFCMCIKWWWCSVEVLCGAHRGILLAYSLFIPWCVPSVLIVYYFMCVMMYQWCIMCVSHGVLQCVLVVYIWCKVNVFIGL